MVWKGALCLLLPTLCSSFATTTMFGTSGSILFRGRTNPSRPSLPRLGASSEPLDCDWEVFGTSRQPSIRCGPDPDHGATRVEVHRDAKTDDADDASSSTNVTHVMASTKFPELVWFDVVVQEECEDFRVAAVSWPGIRTPDDDERDHLYVDANGTIHPSAFRSQPLHRGDRIVFECEVDPSCNGVRVECFLNGYRAYPAWCVQMHVSRCPPPMAPWISFAGASAAFTCNVTTERPPGMVLDERGRPVGQLAEDQPWRLPHYMPRTCAEQRADREAFMKKDREQAGRQPARVAARAVLSYDSEDNQSRVENEWDTYRHETCGDQDMIGAMNERATKAFLDAFGFDEDAVDSYEPDHPGGCIRNLEQHIRLLDQSLQDASGQSLFGWIQTRLHMEGKNPLQFLETARDLHLDDRFGIVSHGTQPDPVCNYGNDASLHLLETAIEELCQTPVSRFFSTVPEELVEDRRSELLAALEQDGHGTIEDAILVSGAGHAFRIPHVVVWTVRDNDGKNIGRAALCDRYAADVYKDNGRYRSVSDLLDYDGDKPYNGAGGHHGSE